MSNLDHPTHKLQTSASAHLRHTGRGWCPRCQQDCVLLDSTEGAGPFSRYDGSDLDERDYGWDTDDD